MTGDVARAGRCHAPREGPAMIDAILATGVALFARAVTGVRGNWLGCTP